MVSPIKYPLLRTALLLIFMLSLNVMSIAQKVIDWGDLSMVTWEEKYDTAIGINLTQGVYDESILALDGEEVIISGYVIPLDALGLSYALSRTSFASCFFCGQAGPETVMELRAPPRSISPNRQKNTLIKFRGTLVVRHTNQDGLHYSLRDAVEI